MSFFLRIGLTCKVLKRKHVYYYLLLALGDGGRYAGADQVNSANFIYLFDIFTMLRVGAIIVYIHFFANGFHIKMQKK